MNKKRKVLFQVYIKISFLQVCVSYFIISALHSRLKKPLAPSSGQVQKYKMTKNYLYVMEKLLPSDISKLINQINTTSHILLWLSRCYLSLKTNQ